MPDELKFIDEQASKMETISKRLSSQIRPTNKSQQARLDSIRKSIRDVRRNTRRSVSRVSRSKLKASNNNREPSSWLKTGNTFVSSPRRSRKPSMSYVKEDDNDDYKSGDTTRISKHVDSRRQSTMTRRANDVVDTTDDSHTPQLSDAYTTRRINNQNQNEDEDEDEDEDVMNNPYTQSILQRDMMGRVSPRRRSPSKRAPSIENEDDSKESNGILATDTQNKHYITPTEDTRDSTIVAHPFSESLANVSTTREPMLKHTGQTIHDTFNFQSVSDLLNKTSSHVQKAMEQSNDVDLNTLEIVRQSAKDTFSVGSGIVMYVVKIFVLICILAYTFTIDTVHCKCADTPRKLLVQCSALIVLLFVVVVLVYPQLYEKVPLLKILLMITTLLLAYGVVTYFPIMNNVECECAQQKWQKYVGEYYVYIALVLFVLAICGIRIL